jgi:hypothetical protein
MIQVSIEAQVFNDTSFYNKYVYCVKNSSFFHFYEIQLALLTATSNDSGI